MEQRPSASQTDSTAACTERAPSADHKNSPLYGVKGWLLFFMLPMMLLGAVFLFNFGFVLSNGMSKLLAKEPGAWGVLGTGFVMYAPLIAVIILTLIRLFRGDIRFRFWYVVYAALTIVNGILPALRDVDHVTGYLIYPAFVIIGCLYLYRADRVRVTCGLPPLHDHADPGKPSPYPKLAMPIRDHRENAYDFPKTETDAPAQDDGGKRA